MLKLSVVIRKHLSLHVLLERPLAGSHIMKTAGKEFSTIVLFISYCSVILDPASFVFLVIIICLMMTQIVFLCIILVVTKVEMSG
jgi:hypothetical protein